MFGYRVCFSSYLLFLSIDIPILVLGICYLGLGFKPRCVWLRD